MANLRMMSHVPAIIPIIKNNPFCVWPVDFTVKSQPQPVLPAVIFEASRLESMAVSSVSTGTVSVPLVSVDVSVPVSMLM